MVYSGISEFPINKNFIELYPVLFLEFKLILLFMGLTVAETSILDSFESLFKENYKALCNTAHQILRDEIAAEDMVQDVFIKLWENGNKLEIRSHTQAYLHKMVVNFCLNHISKKKVIRFNSLESDTRIESVENRNIETEIDFTKLESLISSGLSSLPSKCRTIFVLCRFENMKYREVAEMLGISIKTVETQMGIAINRLDKHLKPLLILHFPDLIIVSLLIYLICFN